MTEPAAATAGTLEKPSDAGPGPQGVVKRWMMEIDLSDKTEKYWREQATDVNSRYRDEKHDETAGRTVSSARYSSGDRFNILYSNIQTICPALYNNVPKPDVRRRYRDNDETGKVIADIMERALSFTMDDDPSGEDFDRVMKYAVKDCQLVGRGITRVKYNAPTEKKADEDGKEYDEVQNEEVEFCHVDWADFRRGPGRTWKEVQWIGFRHTFDEAELKANFPDTYQDIEMDYTPDGVNEDDDPDPIVDTFKRAIVWEIWDKKTRKVLFIAPSLKERPAKTLDDPLSLKGFYPIPRPLYSADYTESLIPVEPFRYYADQADELDVLTRRITAIIDSCKVRGIYDSTIAEMSNLMDSSENTLQPATDVLAFIQGGGLEKAIWMFPLEKLVTALPHLYTQREAVKTIIYEITGIADIMRGSSAASETLGAQQLKAQFGTMRLDDMRREVQRYARDLVRMAAEIIAEQFSPETMSIMTQVKLPTVEQKSMAMQAAQQMEQQQQPIPRKIKEDLELPTWDDALKVLRDDQQREYRIDIETDSTISGDQAQDQKAITELLTGISTFIQNAGPAVEAGYLPIEAAKSMLMTAVRKFKMGREVEDALDMIGEEEGEDAQPDPQMLAMQEQMQELQGIAGELQKENEALKADKSAEEQRTMMEGGKAQAELSLKEREIALKEFEAQKPGETPVDPQYEWQYNMQMEREKQAFEAQQNELDRQVDIAKTIIAKQDGPEGGEGGEAMDQSAAILETIKEALTAPKVVIRDALGNVVGSETVID